MADLDSPLQQINRSQSKSVRGECFPFAPLDTPCDTRHSGRTEKVSNHVFRLDPAFLKQFDVALCVSCNRLSRSFTLRNFFRMVSRLGDGVFWYVLMISFLLQDGYDALPAVLHMLLAGGAGTVLYKLIKGKTLRPRPFNVYPAIQCMGKTLDQFSFPSGHTLHATVFCIVTLAYYPALFWLVTPFAVMVAFSRPILGLHYPSDVLAGAALGALIAWLSFLFV